MPSLFSQASLAMAPHSSSSNSYTIDISSRNCSFSGTGRKNSSSSIGGSISKIAAINCTKSTTGGNGSGDGYCSSSSSRRIFCRHRLHHSPWTSSWTTTTMTTTKTRMTTTSVPCGWLLVLIFVALNSVGLPLGLAATTERELSGPVDECECSVEDLAQFNAFHIYPQIQGIAHKDYFRYFKVDLARECPYWHDDSTCAMKDCSVEICDEENVPFVRAEKLRLGSGSGELQLDEAAHLESSQPRAAVGVGGGGGAGGGVEGGVEGLVSEELGELPYYERARTKSVAALSAAATAAGSARTAAGTTAAVRADAGVEPVRGDATSSSSRQGVDKTESPTKNVVRPTSTSPTAQITMATTVLPTLESVVNAGQSQSAGELDNAKETTTTTIRTALPDATTAAGASGVAAAAARTMAADSLLSDQQSYQASCKEHNRTLGKIDDTISEESLREFERWRRHDASLQNFCVFDDENSANASYVDLLLNPERFTGYSGPSANRVWKSIYEENCFKSPQGSPLDLNQMCLEKRVFYRVISGLHSSINIHLCAEYYLPKMGRMMLPGEQMWGPNLSEFARRFSAAQTNGEGPRRLKNLYFLYLLEMRALRKASAFLGRTSFYTSRPDDADETREAVTKFLATVAQFKSHFNESRMFVGPSHETLRLREEFRLHFLNISTIMDCVGCDKCRLWGKLQTQGLGTALKILFSDEGIELTRTEIVTLFNSFNKLSNSLFQLDNFYRMMKEAASRNADNNNSGGRSSSGSSPFSRRKMEL